MIYYGMRVNVLWCSVLCSRKCEGNRLYAAFVLEAWFKFYLRIYNRGPMKLSSCLEFRVNSLFGFHFKSLFAHAMIHSFILGVSSNVSYRLRTGIGVRAITKQSTQEKNIKFDGFLRNSSSEFSSSQQFSNCLYSFYVMQNSCRHKPGCLGNE